MKHLEDNLGAGGWALSEEKIQPLNQASDQLLPNPYDFIARAQGGR